MWTLLATDWPLSTSTQCEHTHRQCTEGHRRSKLRPSFLRTLLPHESAVQRSLWFPTLLSLFRWLLRPGSGQNLLIFFLFEMQYLKQQKEAQFSPWSNTPVCSCCTIEIRRCSLRSIHTKWGAERSCSSSRCNASISRGCSPSWRGTSARRVRGLRLNVKDKIFQAKSCGNMWELPKQIQDTGTSVSSHQCLDLHGPGIPDLLELPEQNKLNKRPLFIATKHGTQKCSCGSAELLFSGKNMKVNERPRKLFFTW